MAKTPDESPTCIIELLLCVMAGGQIMIMIIILILSDNDIINIYLTRTE